MIILIINEPTVAKAAYPNEKAHKELITMMNRKEAITLYFSRDSYGFVTAVVESRTTEKFSYQLSQAGLDMLIGYLVYGTIDDKDVDPTAPFKVEDGVTPDAIRFDMLKSFLKSKLGVMKTIPAFRDKPDRLTVSAKLKHGTVIFYLERTPEAEGLLR